MGFEKLLEPCQIGSLALRNRIVMPPMAERYGQDGYVTRQQVDYYEARAAGGVGLVIVGGSAVDHRLGTSGPVSLYLDDDRFVPGLARLARAIKRHGARAAIQLYHSGGRAQKVPAPVAPSAVLYEGCKPAHPLSVAEIGNLIAMYAQAARRAQVAGFDAVELHAAHGFLISEFLSRAWNKRDDQYGGSVANRARFAVELVHAIKATNGPDFAVWCRYNCAEPGIENGLTEDEVRQIATILEEAGADAVHVSSDNQVFTGVPRFSPSGYMLPLARKLKEVVSVPVLVAGWITLEQGERALLEGVADLICFGRALIADPELPNKLGSGRREDVVPCIRCLKCFGERSNWEEMTTLGGVCCSVNAAAGNEREFQIQRAKVAKKVLVVGGGPGGMEAARVAALRGHAVTLVEKTERLGGQLLPAAIPAHKQPILGLIDYMAAQLAKRGVEVQLGRVATPEVVRAFGADAVVVATGVVPFVPGIPGLAQANVVLAEDVLAGLVAVGQQVAVIGGEMVGCETAEFLADQGREVTLLTRKPAMASKTNWLVRRALLLRLAEKNVQLITGARYLGATERGLCIVGDDGTERLITADTLVLATGGRANDVLFRALEGQGPELYRVGDCREPRGIMEAIQEGAQVARDI